VASVVGALTLFFVVVLGSLLTGYVYAEAGLPFALLVIVATLAVGARLLSGDSRG
jgi:flagellar motor component MotA